MSATSQITSMLIGKGTHYTFDPPAVVNPGDVIWPSSDGSIIVTVDGGWPRHYQGQRPKRANHNARWVVFEEAVRGAFVEQGIAFEPADDWTETIVGIARETLGPALAEPERVTEAPTEPAR